MSMVGTNKPRCPACWDNARGRIRVSKAADRLPASGARIRVGTAGDLGGGQEMSQGHALSSPLGERHKTDPGEALGNRTWILMCVYKMLLVASHDRWIISPLSAVPHYFSGIISVLSSPVSCLAWVVLKHFCCSAQKTTDVSPFPLAAVAKSLPMRSDNLLVLPAAALEPLMPGQCCPCLPSQFCHLFFGTHWWHLGSLCICFKALFFTFNVFSVAPLTCSCPDFPLGSVIPFTPSHSVPLSIISYLSNPVHPRLYPMSFLLLPLFAFPVLHCLFFGARSVPSSLSESTAYNCRAV